MKPALSIIMPCYNSSKTVEESVESCFTQGLDAGTFEIIAVNDGSTDQTKEVLERLAAKHSEIRIFSHAQNMGGGRARNTAVEKSAADVIFCLDSDDILMPNTLGKMISHLHKKKCDGVAFSGAYSFSKDKETAKKIDFGLPSDQPIRLDYLFSQKAWVGGNFLYTKKAFETAGGYPTDHSFDTQGYGFRFLAQKLTAYPCPDTFLYQRQFSGEMSYFERAYASGEFSVGHYMMFLEHINVFAGPVQEMILQYDIFKKNTLDMNILSEMQKEFAADPGHFFSQTRDKDAANPEAIYQKGRYRDAFNLLIEHGRKYNNSDFDAVRYALASLRDSKTTLTDYRNFIGRNRIERHAYNLLRPTLAQKIKRKIMTHFTKK